MKFKLTLYIFTIGLFFNYQVLAQPKFKNVWLTNLQGNKTLLTLNKTHKATVLFFLSPECPLCQSYSLTIKDLQQQFGSNKMRFIAIIPGTDFTALQVATFKKKFSLNNLEFYFDNNLKLTRILGATITPEVFVLNQIQQTVYSGRIDNWAYALARKRQVITQHDLKDCLTLIANNKPVKHYKTKAVGCFIE